MFATILSAVINIVLNFILIPRYQEKCSGFYERLSQKYVYV